jgi:hypothetical protein
MLFTQEDSSSFEKNEEYKTYLLFMGIKTQADKNSEYEAEVNFE